MLYKNKIFQIATDCVFDGEKGNYSELDSHNARDVYGKSKSLGEVNNKNFYNLRCSFKLVDDPLLKWLVNGLLEIKSKNLKLQFI